MGDPGVRWNVTHTTPPLLLVAFVATLLPAPAWAESQAPDREDLLLQAGQAVKKGREHKAFELMEKVLSADPRDAEALALGVDVALNLGEYGRAEDWSRKALALKPDDRAARLGLARVLADQGRVDQVLECLKPLLGTASPLPKDVPALDFEAVALAARVHTWRGRDQVAEGLYDRLVQEAKRVVIRDPRALMALAEADLFFGGVDEAEVLLAKDVQPVLKDDPAPGLALAELLRNRKYLAPQAVKELKEIQKIRPNLAEAWWGLAEAYRASMKGDEARQALQTCLRVNPRHLRALARNGAEALGDLELEAADDAIRKMLAVDPECREALALQAARNYLMNERGAYDRDVRKVLAIDPTYAKVHVVLAEILNERRRWPEALELARAATNVDPKDAAVHDLRARFAFFMGQEKEGEEALRKANDLDRYGHVWRQNMFEVMKDLRRSYREARTEHFVHRIHKEEQRALEPYLLPFCEQSWRELTTKYRFTPPGVEGTPGRILVETFRQHEGFSARTLGFPRLGASGVCFGGLIVMDSPAALPLGQNSWARTFHHELTHSMTLGLSKGRVPRWLTEGLSTYEEAVKDPSWVRPMERELYDAFRSDDLLPVLHFDAAFSTPRVIFAYYQGGLACGWMVERFGFDRVLKVLEAYGEDRPTAEVLTEVLGVSPADFDRGFREFVAGRLEPVRLLPRWSEKKVTEFEERLKTSPEDVEALLGVAAARMAAKATMDAEEYLLRARKAAPEDARVDHLLGRIAAANKRTDAARTNFEAALARGYRDHDLHVDLARILDAAGDHEGAKQQLLLAVETFPGATGHGDPRLELARLAEGAGNAEEAAGWLEKHLERAFENVGVRKKLVSWYQTRKDRENQRRHLGALLLIDPFDADVHLRLGDLFLEAKEAKSAVREFEAGLAVLDMPRPNPAPGMAADLHVRLARAILLDGGEAEDALEHAEKALTLIPGHAEARKLADELRARKGQEPGERR